MLFQGNVGRQTNVDGAQNVVARFGRTGVLTTDETNGRFYENTSRGQMFSAANQQARTISTGFAFITGLIVSNPIGSPVQVALQDLCISIASAPAAASTLALAGTVQQLAAFAGSPVFGSITAEVVVNNLLGSNGMAVGTGAPTGGVVGNALAWRAVSLAVGASYLLRAIGGGPVATGSVNAPYIRDELAGQVILLPGTIAHLVSLTTAITAVSSMSWIENPL